MSGGGGLIIIRHGTKVALSSDFKSLNITNDSSADLTLSQSEIDGLAGQYCPDPNTVVGLSKTDSGWTVTSGPST